MFLPIMRCCSLRLFIIALLFVVFNSGLLCADDIAIRSDTLSDLAKELISVQESYLSCIYVIPSGKHNPNSDSELIRRIALVIDTWNDYQRGVEDAESMIEKGHLTLKGSFPLNDIEGKYVELLDSFCGCRFETTLSSVTNVHKLIYVYGFNSRMEKKLFSEYGKITLGKLISKSVVTVCGSGCDFSYHSACFVPWRFSLPAENIRVVKRRRKKRCPSKSDHREKCKDKF